jgi:hypothetical protein
MRISKFAQSTLSAWRRSGSGSRWKSVSPAVKKTAWTTQAWTMPRCTLSPPMWDVYTALNPISPNFSIAAAFGNVHGVYKSGNVKLHPDLLEKHQEYVTKQLQGTVKKPL